jgi:hypothetical protein
MTNHFRRVAMGTVYTARQLGKRMGLSTRTVLDLARRGVIPCVRFNARVIRFDLEAVMRELQQRGALPERKKNLHQKSGRTREPENTPRPERTTAGKPEPTSAKEIDRSDVATIADLERCGPQKAGTSNSTDANER